MAITADRDKLRLALGDRDSTNYIFNDDELDSFLADESTVAAATLAAARAAEMTFARAYDFETDGQKFSRSQMAKAFATIVGRLESRGVTTTTDSATTGISTLSSTRIDGYSQEIDSEEVFGSGTATTNPRQTFYTVDGIDQLP